MRIGWVRVGEPRRVRFGFGEGGDVRPGRGPLVEEREGERVGGVVHHGEGNAKRKRGEARTMGRGDGYKRDGIIGDIMIYGW